MLFTNKKYLISDQNDNGKELKEFATKAKLRFDYYYFENGIRYMIITTRRGRNIMKYMAGNIRNKSEWRVFMIGDRVISYYLKTGKVKNIDIGFNIRDILTKRTYLKMIEVLFGVKVRQRDITVRRKPTMIELTLHNNLFDIRLVFAHKYYKIYLNKTEIEPNLKFINLINRHLVDHPPILQAF